MIRKILISVFLGIFAIVVQGFSMAEVDFTITTPKNSDNIKNADAGQISGSSDYMYNLMSYINENIWYIITVLLFGLLLRAGFELLVGEGKDEILKKINYFVLYALIGLLVASMSYVLIDVIINLFK